MGRRREGENRDRPTRDLIDKATNRDLTTSVESGGFRRDLYARLALWEIAVPPLRERRADLLDWIDRFRRCWLADRPDQPPSPRMQFSPAAAERIILADWPENLRGIGRLVHDLASRPGSGRIEVHELPVWLSRSLLIEEPRPPSARVGRASVRRPTPTPDELAAAMRELDGSVRAVARRFDRDRRQIYRWIDAFGLHGYRRGNR